jgi:hypothetical protein
MEVCRQYDFSLCLGWCENCLATAVAIAVKFTDCLDYQGSA